MGDSKDLSKRERILKIFYLGVAKTKQSLTIFQTLTYLELYLSSPANRCTDEDLL